MSAVDDFILSLRDAPPPPAAVFNPWWAQDSQHDATSEGPQIRREQLRHYLNARLGHARFALIGEALSYNGGHFTGIAMTSERILLGDKSNVGVQPHHVLPGMTAQRTSQPEIRPLGFTEPTGTMVWSTLLQNGLGPLEFVLWNAFPWHPYKLAAGLLSNRCPTPSERLFGREILQRFLEMFQCPHIVAVGKTSEGLLAELGVKSECVRHPACGGATQFRKQMKRMLVPP